MPVKSPRYTPEHANSGLDVPLPEIECWPNQFPAYEIVIDNPEFTSVCPKTGLPDFGTIIIRYMPNKLCLELKSLKEYMIQYRSIGIFQENAVNRILEDVVRAAQPKWAVVKGDFRPRGGMGTVVEARWPRASARITAAGSFFRPSNRLSESKGSRTCFQEITNAADFLSRLA